MENKIPVMTSEDRLVMVSNSPQNAEARAALIARLRSESQAPATQEDSTAAQAIYDQHKIDGSIFLSASVTLPDGSGIINCRVGGDHKQIRF